MRTLIYKRTHHGDPDETGRFGIHDCMGRVRAWNFDAVIGVGGVGAEPRSHGLDGKINWIGIGPSKIRIAGKRGPIVTFEHYVFFGSRGPLFENLAPHLADRMYSKNVRVAMNGLTEGEQKEVQAILSLAKDAPPSPGQKAEASEASRTRTKRCSPSPTQEIGARTKSRTCRD